MRRILAWWVAVWDGDDDNNDDDDDAEPKEFC